VLETRGVLILGGTDRVRFLQGLVSNDVTRVGPDRTIAAALLTPQGKMLFDLLVADLQPSADGQAEDREGALVIDAETARLEDLRARLSKFKLRSKITLTLGEGWVVAVVFGAGAAAALGLPDTAGATRALSGGGVAFVDPRLSDAGVRLILPTNRAARLLDEMVDERGATLVEPTAWTRHRLALGVPEGTPDIGAEKSLPLECGVDDLNGVDFGKGCYMGQELTARVKHRGLLKRRLMPVAITGPLPAPGTPLITAAGKDGGEMRSGLALDDESGLGLAIVRLEALAEGRPLQAGATRLTPCVPDWMRLPDSPVAPS